MSGLIIQSSLFPYTDCFRSLPPFLSANTPAEARQNLLNQILEPDAADRLARIRLVKQERASAVEDRLLMLAQSGQLRGKVSEDQLKDMLTRLSAAEDAKRGTSSSAGRIVVDRRAKGGFDDDDLDLDL